MKYSMFVGRWQPWHEGHRWLINQRLILGKNVLICVRDVPKDADNPYSPDDIVYLITQELSGLIEEGRVKIMIIPDIESINYGRSVGYEIIEHVPPSEISKISSSKIRQEYPEILPEETKGIKIIDRKPHKSVVKKYICKDCGASLECTPNDITYKWYSDYGGGSDRYAEFICPNCNKKQQYCE
jgi:hypothetical protein